MLSLATALAVRYFSERKLENSELNWLLVVVG